MTTKNITAPFDSSFIAISKAPVSVIPANTSIDRIVVVLSGSRFDEYVLPHALERAYEIGAELVVIHMYKSAAASYRSDLIFANQQAVLTEHAQQAQLYMKTIKHKLQMQYGRVRCYVHEGTDIVSAIQSVATDDRERHAVILPENRKNWLARLFRQDVRKRLEQTLGNSVTIEEVER